MIIVFRTIGTIVLVGALAFFFVRCIAVLGSETVPPGDDILSQAASAGAFSSYSVPVHFAVHLKRPIGVRAPVEGIVYFRAPASAALVLTKVPSALGHFFTGSYQLAMTPQTWPSQYQITSVTQAQSDATPTYVLNGVPRVADPSIERVEITVAQADDNPLTIGWYYKDKSTIFLTMENQRISGAAVPRTEKIDVNMPGYAIDAVATYGEYALNVPISDDVFRKR